MSETELAKRQRRLANQVWNLVSGWSPFARDTVGKQLVRSIDRVGANLIEGDGRYRDGDALHFFVISRGSLREAEYWISLAKDRELLIPDDANSILDELSQLGRMLNAFINFRRQNKDKNIVREDLNPYRIEDGPRLSPFSPDDSEDFPHASRPAPDALNDFV